MADGFGESACGCESSGVTMAGAYEIRRRLSIEEEWLGVGEVGSRSSNSQNRSDGSREGRSVQVTADSNSSSHGRGSEERLWKVGKLSAGI
jgi:hypothetical protein